MYTGELSPLKDSGEARCKWVFHGIFAKATKDCTIINLSLFDWLGYVNEEKCLELTV